MSDALGKKKKKARYTSVLAITTDHVPEAQAHVEQVLGKITKRWKLDEVVTNTGKPSEIYFLVRLKKTVPRDDLLTAIHDGSDGVIETATLETGAPLEDKKDSGKA